MHACVRACMRACVRATNVRHVGDLSDMRVRYALDMCVSPAWVGHEVRRVEYVLECGRRRYVDM